MTTVRICIDVPDLDQAIAFYAGTFGWTPRRRKGFVELEGAPVPVDLLPRAIGTRTSRTTATARSYDRHWTPIHLDFIVDDVDAAVARAVALGARVESAPTDHAFGRIAELGDPFGHGLCIIQLSARGYEDEP